MKREEERERRGAGNEEYDVIGRGGKWKEHSGLITGEDRVNVRRHHHWLAGPFSFESRGNKVTRLMYSDSVDGRLSDKVLGVHLCRPFEISTAYPIAPFFPFPSRRLRPRKIVFPKRFGIIQFRKPRGLFFVNSKNFSY